MAALPVTYEQEGGIVILTLNEPETRNALSPEINDMLVEYVTKINKDYSVGCVIVTGAGEGFSSGGNVKRMQDRSTSAVQKPPVDVRRYYTEGIQRVPVAIYNLEAPIIAAVNGAAIGAGLDLATMRRRRWQRASLHILCMPFVLARSWYVTRNM